MKKLVFVFLLLAVFLTGCGREEAPMTAGSYMAQGEITAVNVNVRDREIRVIRSQDEQVRIDYFHSQKEFYDIRVSEGCLTMTAEVNKEAEDYVGRNAPKGQRVITLALPETVLSQLTLSTTNENISLPELAVSDSISLSANGGNITFDTLDVGAALNLDVKNGDITGKVLGGYDDFAISCTIKKGDSNLPEAKAGGGKTLTVTANNGDVQIELNNQ